MKKIDEIFAEERLSVIEFDAVYEHLKAIAKQEGYDANNVKDMSKSLSLYVLQEYFESIGNEELESCITDGSNDHGIDAVYIEEKEDGSNTVHIIQTKLCTSRVKFNEQRFSANEADKLMSKFDDIVINRNHLNQVNERLRNKLEEVARLENKKYNIILVTTAQPPAADAIQRMKSKVEDYNKIANFVSLDFVGLKKLVSMLPSLQESKLDFKLRMEGGVVVTHSGKARVIVGTAQTRRIASLVADYGEKLFDKNVRVYLRKRNQVNQKIYNTASDPESSKYFFILNNGITIVCEKVEYLHGESSPDITVKGAQIVNGGQTSNSIYESFLDKKLQDTAEVLVRIIETDDKEILDMVTEATNSQTPVRNPDLHSNDKIQQVLQQYIKDKYGYYYETKTNEFQGKQPNKKRIDKVSATQAYYAFSKGEPAFAKSNKSKLFGEEYENIFNDNLDYEEFFFAYHLLVALKSLSNTVEVNMYGFHRDALLTSLALSKSFLSIQDFKSLQKDGANGYKQLLNDYQKILEKTQIVLKEEVKRLGDDFEKRRFFIAPSSVGRIHEALTQDL